MIVFPHYNNIDFLKKIHPIKVILLAFLTWIALFITSPLSVQIKLNFDAYILLFLNILAFIFGTLLYKNKTNFYIIPKSNKHLIKLFRIIFNLALLGLTVKIFDRFFIRGITIGAGYFDNRELMEGAGGNAFAIFSAVLSPLGIIPLFLLLKYNLKFNRFYKGAIFLLFFAQIFDAILLGSRSILFILFILFGLYMAFFKKIRFTFRKSIIVLFAFLAFLFLMNFIFLERTREFAGNKTYEIVLNESNVNYTLTSNKEFKNNFRNMNSISQTISFTYITTIQYFTHGMIEFSYLYDNFHKEHSLGGYTFAVYDRFFSKIMGTNFDQEKLQKLAPREGVYTTFFGPLYLDFGWLTIVFMLLFGKVTRNIYEKSKKGSDWAIIMLFYFFIVLMFAPVFNFVNGAGGIFILTSLLIFSIISNRFYKYEKLF
ncbi:oligosaccharide repeat unit polymerase [Salinimicrobium catena]|uniref:Oligosaccharide repeat unit polymerase n=1 Tax=Salinimicrobium catena TaxID=390640 RepID=A0A1H5PG88_9FLAO|nr:O-antigen polymerase [Salinimicrobium catena]SDL80885.1 oligosaccharide repeat unit polymerase [Salinimicrobium catena]SEF12081.1 oligosaccharide repeat unit polymerase [Salinimicrobium catena]